MVLSGAAPDPQRAARTAATVQRESAGRTGMRESKLRERIEKWAGEIGYWGQASNIVVGESIATDYFPPSATATFRIGSLSFHCVQDDETGDFRVKLEGSRIRHIADPASLHRAIAEREHDVARARAQATILHDP